MQNYEITFDMALVITTSAHKYIISRGWQFDEILDGHVDRELNDIYPVEKVVEEWNNLVNGV